MILNYSVIKVSHLVVKILEEMTQKRDVEADHTLLCRWIQSIVSTSMSHKRSLFKHR